ncbi:NAD(P)/FAD-dependent oxidoreductase [Pseudarthrobacter raffinosi]|uniref:NAD(P)/FAD-dependent oxidoreductase n=1 Tax=Pseudarthrobacter raffinosi TaxID=2953651 RepID=UPI00208F5473|nr:MULTISPECIES: FAD/NAD(P)-binding oxidoreductase [unclassified Pseudarthrobacter]MCO4251568.1 NAD(P)/FAD-dependent oxidoreductase [Pseudarthrobacter sp. MDT3-9]MCO4264583.1 NAD(P)/FAD-dependent oxidoreductase [Pseudarthrobacter sp. MDT3-26]
MNTTTVIVGSSIGGVRAAQSLRLEGYEGEIILVGEDPELPYDKPPLSKSVLAGKAEESSIRLLTREQAEDAGIQLLLGHAATGIDVAGNLLQLQDHEPVRFDHLVIATGASARPSPWGQRPGIHVLRSLDDARKLRTNLLKGGTLAVIGAGFIGAEAAATARSLGLEVTVIDPLPIPMSRIFNPEIGHWFGDLHRNNGVTTIFGTGVESIDGEQGSFTLRLTNGANVEAATVLVGIGAVPNDAWLGASGLLVDNGVVLDEYCRAVDAPHIYGVGDVARWRHEKHGEDIRIEHWTNAVEQAACVAYNITHPQSPRAYTPVEYVWSDQHDWKIQVVGRVGGNAEHIIIGHPELHGRFAALYTTDGVNLRGAAIVNWPKALLACRRGMGTGVTIQELREKLEPLLDPQPLAAS